MRIGNNYTEGKEESQEIIIQLTISNDFLVEKNRKLEEKIKELEERLAKEKRIED